MTDHTIAVLALITAVLAMAASTATAWLTFFRVGQLKMTQPTTVFFGPDGGRRDGEAPHLKVYLRTLLYSTSKRGQTLESLHISLQRGESRQNFSVWVYGEERLVRGSGLFVGQDGIATNHHFLLPKDGASFKLTAGRYILRVYGKRTTERTPQQLAEFTLTISEAQAHSLENPHAGIYFDWGPDQQAYHPHVEVRKMPPMPAWLLEAADTLTQEHKSQTVPGPIGPT